MTFNWFPFASNFAVFRFTFVNGAISDYRRGPADGPSVPLFTVRSGNSCRRDRRSIGRSCGAAVIPIMGVIQRASDQAY
jgi:hypothetical protein